MNSIKIAWHFWSDWEHRPIKGAIFRLQGNLFTFSLTMNKSHVIPSSLELHIGLIGFNGRITLMFISKEYEYE